MRVLLLVGSCSMEPIKTPLVSWFKIEACSRKIDVGVLWLAGVLISPHMFSTLIRLLCPHHTLATNDCKHIGDGRIPMNNPKQKDTIHRDNDLIASDLLSLPSILKFVRND